MDNPITTWGSKHTEPDIRALKLWIHVLKKVDKFNEVLSFLLLIMIAGVVVAFFLHTNFEITIFNDGTDKSCVLNGQTGNIENAK